MKLLAVQKEASEAADAAFEVLRGMEAEFEKASSQVSALKARELDLVNAIEDMEASLRAKKASVRWLRLKRCLPVVTRCFLPPAQAKRYRELITDVQAEFESTLFADEGESAQPESDAAVAASSDAAAPSKSKKATKSAPAPAKRSTRGRKARVVDEDSQDEDMGDEVVAGSGEETEEVVTRRDRKAAKHSVVHDGPTTLSGNAASRTLPSLTREELLVMNSEQLMVRACCPPPPPHTACFSSPFSHGVCWNSTTFKCWRRVVMS